MLRCSKKQSEILTVQPYTNELMNIKSKESLSKMSPRSKAQTIVLD